MNNLKKYLIIIILMIVSVTIIISLIKNKPNNNLSLDDIKSQNIETEQVSIKIDDVTLADNYLILRYNFKVKDNSKDILDSAIQNNKFNLRLDRRILINDHTITKEFIYTNQIADRISDSEAIIYDIIDVSDETIPDIFDIKIKFFENEFTSFFKEENTIDDFTPSGETQGTQVTQEYNESENISNKTEENTVFEENYEEVVGEYEWTEEMAKAYEDTLNAKEGFLISEINSKITKSSINTGKKIIYAKQLETNNVNVMNTYIIQTPYANFIFTETEIKNVDYNSLYTGENNDPWSYGIDIQTDSESLVKSEINEISLIDENQNQDEQINSNSKNITAHIRTFIELNEIYNKETEIFIKPYYEENSNKNYIGEGF